MIFGFVYPAYFSGEHSGLFEVPWMYLKEKPLCFWCMTFYRPDVHPIDSLKAIKRDHVI